MSFRAPSPEPANWRELVDASDNPYEFARLCNEYYAEVGAQQAVAAIDFTLPRRTAVDI